MRIRAPLLRLSECLLLSKRLGTSLDLGVDDAATREAAPSVDHSWQTREGAPFHGALYRMPKNGALYRMAHHPPVRCR